MSNILSVIVLSVIEGLTEFIPVSSTGHMILAEKYLTSHTMREEFLNSFYMIVQIGAILAAVIYFWGDLNPFTDSRENLTNKMNLWIKIAIGAIPAGIIGVIGDKYIESIMGGVIIIAVALIFYGIIFLFIEDRLLGKEKIITTEGITYKVAFYIGLFQCLALIPGTSRSGATIIGALILGVSKVAATEFSFFLAIPVIMGSGFLKILKNGMNFTTSEWHLVLIGLIVSFITSYIVIKWFMNYIKTKSFKLFGIYRILLGIIILFTLL